MSTRHVPDTAPKPRTVARPNARRRVDAILSRREELVAEIAALREQGSRSKFIENAHQLLTRSWSTADWNAREELLKSADWLVRIESRRDARFPMSQQLQDTR